MNAAAPGQFGKIALRGGILTGLSQAIRIAIQFLSVVILARLLLPEDFGLVASVTPIVAFVGLFQNLGLQQAVIQRRDISQRQLNQVFWVSAAVGLCCTAIVAALSPAIALFYDDPRMTGIALASGAPLFLFSFAALPLALMNRRLQFGQLALNDVMAALGGLVATIAAAYAGLGYWSLVIGPAVSAIVTLAAAWRTARWTPGKPELRIDREILSFGANLTGFNLVNFFARNLDTLLIAKFSGATQLGYYDRAYKLMLFPLQNITQPLSRLMIPILSRIQDDKKRFRDIYMETNWLLAGVTAPGIAALTMTAGEVVSVLFGERWLPVAAIFAWLGIASLTQPISATSGWIFICQGRTRTMFRWGVYSSITTVAAFAIGIQWGAVGVAAAYAISGYALRIPVLAALLHRVGPITAWDFLMPQLLFVVSALAAWACYLALPHSWVSWNLSAIAIAVGLNYGLALLLMLAVPTPRRALVAAWNRVRTATR